MPTEEGRLATAFSLFKFVERMRLQNWWFDGYKKLELLHYLQYQVS